MKKKLESDVLELETELDHANAANVESQRAIKVVGQKIREAQARMEEESRANPMSPPPKSPMARPPVLLSWLTSSLPGDTLMELTLRLRGFGVSMLEGTLKFCCSTFGLNLSLVLERLAIALYLSSYLL